MEKIKETLNYLKDRIDNFKPEIAIVLGSGLGVFCDDIDGTAIKYSEIPNFLTSNIMGHKGELVYCKIFKKNCAIKFDFLIAINFLILNLIKNVLFISKIIKDRF